MPTDQDRIRAYYERFDEWGRLDSKEGRPEFVRVLSLLEATLRPRSRILDLGGGPGRYTFALAQRGHRLVLADLSPRLLDVAREHRASFRAADHIESIDEADARDLARYGDTSFDAVMAFGPFYHLVDADERQHAASEIARVTKANGLCFVAFLPYLSGITGLIQRAATSPEQVTAETLQHAVATGVFRNATPTGFQEGYFAKPDELVDLVAQAGFTRGDVTSLRSITYGLEEPMAQLSDATADAVRVVAGALAGDSSVVASSGHAVLVARRLP